MILPGLALAFFLLEWIPGFAGPYGYFIDELYYVACSERLAFGYVDHPPLSIFLLRLVRETLGDSLPAIRLVPALAGAATILLTGLIARRLGAGRYGQAIAALAAMVGSVLEVLFGVWSMNALGFLFWAAAFLILVEIERRDEPRLWLAFGAVAGLALENKHTFVLMGAGLAVGLVLTPARRHLASRWLWMGAGIALLLLAPNLLWQQANGWPSLEFYRNADLYKNLPTPPLEVLKQQILFMNPAALPVWIAGVVFLLATERGRRYRHLGWLFVTLLALMVASQKSRPDRITAAYIIVFAGGGVLLESLSMRGGLRWIRPAVPALLAISGVALAPLAIPLLPPATTARYGSWLGIVPQIERGEGKRTQLPQWLADRFGWEQFVGDIEEAAGRLNPDERRHAIVIVPSYGHAGAIELLGRGRDLPPVYSGQNTSFLWGPPPEEVSAAIMAGFREETLREFSSEVELAGVHDCDWCMPWRDGIPIRIARRPFRSFHDAWPDFKHFE